jgi:hypothetical protein
VTFDAEQRRGLLDDLARGDRRISTSVNQAVCFGQTLRLI